MKHSITLLLVTTLAACGGGESSTNTTQEPVPAPAPLAITVNSSALVMDESTSTQVTLSYTNTDGEVNLTVDSFVSDFADEQYSVTANNTDKTITVNMGDVYIDGDLSFTVTGKDNSKTDSVNITVSVNNTSVIATLDKLTALTASFDSLSGKSETRKVLSRLNDLSLLLGVIEEPDALARIQSIDSALDESFYADLSSALKGQDHVALYEQGTDELALNEVLTTVELNLPLYSKQLYDLLVDTQHLLGEQIIPPFPENSFYVDIENQSVSRFWMNPAMGEVVDGKYSFNSEYAYLTAVLFPESQPCNQ